MHMYTDIHTCTLTYTHTYTRIQIYTHAHTHKRILTYILSLTHSLTQSLIHSHLHLNLSLHSHSLSHSYPHTLIFHSLIHTLVHSHSFPQLLPYYFNCSIFIHLILYSFNLILLSFLSPNPAVTFVSASLFIISFPFLSWWICAQASACRSAHVIKSVQSTSHRLLFQDEEQ